MTHFLISALVAALMATMPPVVVTSDNVPDVSDSDLADTITNILLPGDNIELPEAQGAVTERADHGQ